MPDDRQMWQWVPIQEPNGTTMKSWSMKVPGGWLIRTVFDTNAARQQNAIGLIFIPEGTEVRFS